MHERNEKIFENSKCTEPVATKNGEIANKREAAIGLVYQQPELLRHRNHRRAAVALRHYDSMRREREEIC